ncbi:hypothetical protein [Vibrio sp.]|uniref:hypothetical protein n=2 Tax=Gammaproteobacteria TaxID=1236 RepID=UPI003AA93760
MQHRITGEESSKNWGLRLPSSPHNMLNHSLEGKRMMQTMRAGVSVGENAIEDDGSIDSGYSIMGIYVLVGMYSKFQISDKIWLNYNPFWLTTISGSETYKDNYYGLGHSHILTHELALSYQISPRLNVRYFANFNEHVDFMDGDQRVEFNYQF